MYVWNAVIFKDRIEMKDKMGGCYLPENENNTPPPSPGIVEILSKYRPRVGC